MRDERREGRFRKALRLAARLAGVALVLGMALWLLWRDEPPPEDADLRNYRRSVRDEDNGFRLVDLTEDDIAWPSDAEEDLLVNCISTTFDVKKAAEIARSNAWWIDKIDTALERREFQVDDEDMKIPRLLGWRRMAYVLTSRSRLHIEEGRPEEAYEDAMRVIRLGSRFQRARGNLIEFLVGAAVQGVGNHRLVHMAIHGELPVQVLRRGMDELGPEVRRNGLADSLRAEYVYMSNALDSHASGMILHESLPRFFFKPAQTKRLLAEKIRSLIEADSTPAASRKPLDLSDLTSSYWEVFLLRKAGSRALEESLPPFEKALKQADTDHIRLAATRVLLALMAHRQEKGALPDSLQALVPAYLGAVPLDPCTGKEFRYSPEKMILYSTGADGIDTGGSTREHAAGAFDDPEEPTLLLDPDAWKLYVPESQAEDSDEVEETQ